MESGSMSHLHGFAVWQVWFFVCSVFQEVLTIRSFILDFSGLRIKFCYKSRNFVVEFGKKFLRGDHYEEKAIGVLCGGDVRHLPPSFCRNAVEGQ